MQQVPVFYRPEMTAATRFFAPGTYKPAEVVEDWQRHGMSMQIQPFEPVTKDDLYRAHTKGYVDGVLACEIANGFGGTQPDVADSLIFTCGSLLAAAKEALTNKLAACAPASGFHHAHFSSSGGFCTFNGLMVTAMHLLHHGLATRVGILDLDQHYGDGTDNILEAIGPVAVDHVTAGAKKRSAKDSESFLLKLPEIVANFGNCSILLYQAGADPHVNDPLGGWMTTEQLQRRDRIVFDGAKRIGLPVAWDLAGGYQRDERGNISPVLEIHRNTMQECIAAYVAPKP